MKNLLFKSILISFFCSFMGMGYNANCQSLLWANKMGGVSTDYGNAVKVDLAGNVYTAGNYNGTADFNPGTEIFNLTSDGNFLAKYDGFGNLIWAKKIGDSYSISRSITTDAVGNIYVTGAFSRTNDFDPEEGRYILKSSCFDCPGGPWDIFVAKYDGTGKLLWAKAMGGLKYDTGLSIAVDVSGNVYTTGYFDNFADLDPGDSTFYLAGVAQDGHPDIFISKLDPSGKFVWAKQQSGIINSGAESASIMLDASGNIYTTGKFDGTVDFDPSIGKFNLNSPGYSDVFISKLDTKGDLVWAKQLGGSTGYAEGFSLSIDQEGNIYTIGFFEGTADFDPGVSTYDLTSMGLKDIFISKLNTSGNFVWAKQIGGSGDDEGNSIVVDGAGNVFATGYFTGTADFDPAITKFNLTSSGNKDIFISQLKSNGVFQSAIRMGGALEDVSKSIDIDAGENIYSAGYFSGTSYFGTLGTAPSLTSTGLWDIYISKHAIITGLTDDDSFLKSIAVYPNPGSGIFTFRAELMKEVKISIVNILGNIVFTSTLNAENMKIDLTQQEKGLYFATFSHEGKMITKKMIIQ